MQNWAKGTQCCSAAMAFTTTPIRRRFPPELVREALESGDAAGFIDAANAGGGGDNITAVILSGDAKEKIDG
ncbi:MAG: hypothetical protein V8Q30_02160 [Acutalibacteraceae bacterium]